DPGAAGDLVEYGRDPAPGGVAHHPHGDGVEERGDGVVQGRGVGGEVGLDVQLAPGDQDGDAVLADGAGHDHRVAGPDLGVAQGDRPVQGADAGRGDVAAVGL